MALSEILCTCGKRFSVQDDGNGVPHPCPDCQMLNVLPRTASLESAISDPGAETIARSTKVLTRVGQTVRDAVKGLPPGTVLGPYRILARIGKGGMGSVYEAMDDRMGRRVALKVLSPELAQRPDFVARFHRESRSLSELSDPRIAKVFFNGAAEGLPFFAMEYIDGQNLEQILDETGPMAPDRVVHLMRESAIGLSAAADQGIIHRDVKPTNLLVDKEGNLRIVDFGLAKSVDSESRLTVTGAVVGTPYYLSPEQGLGKPVDLRSDIYSLGATFYHLLAGDPPFDAESPVSIIMRHVHDAPEILTARNSKVPEPLARVVMRCIAKDPNRRYPDYDELLEDLEAVRLGEPVVAPPQEASIKKSGPSVVVMDELEEGVSVLRRASRLRRAFAFAIDFGVLSLVWLMVTRILRGRVSFDPLLILLPFSYLYIAVGDGLGGRSVGKRLGNLRVARPDGSGPGFVGAAVRGLLCLPFVLLVALSRDVGLEQVNQFLGRIGLQDTLTAQSFAMLANLIYATVIIDLGLSLFTRRREALHDLLSRTSVFREQRIKKRKRKSVKKKVVHKRGPTSVARDFPHPSLPTLGSLFVPGLGQLLNGQGSKGLVFFVGLVVALVVAAMNDDFWLPMIIWGLNVYDAHRSAQKQIEASRRDSSARDPLSDI